MNATERSTQLDESAVASRRAALFHETRAEALRRCVLGTAWALRPQRIARLLPIARVTIAHLFGCGRALPDTDTLPAGTEIVGVATDLSPGLLMDAYARGIFPHGHVLPPKWVCPSERAVVNPRDFHVSSRLRSKPKTTTAWRRASRSALSMASAVSAEPTNSASRRASRLA